MSRVAYEEWADRLPDVAPKKIGERLECARKALGIETQKEFAERAGMKPQHYSNMLSGTNTPTVYHLASFANTYRLTMDFIVLGELSGIKPHGFQAELAKWLDVANRLNRTRRKS
jgi:transcriptional regulator with XRE-family HTH domain